MALFVHQPETPPDPQDLLIYDGECRLCVAAKEGLERHGEHKRVRFIAYNSTEAASILGEGYQPGRPEVAFLVESNGGIQRGLDAFLPLLPGLPGGRIILKLWRIRFLRPLGYAAYRFIANNRYRWFGAVRQDYSSQGPD